MRQSEVAVRAEEIEGVQPVYKFSSVMPQGWKAESIPGTQAINLYDPTSSEDSSLEQSQIFIRFFEASDFLTLSTVTIFNQRAFTLGGRPAVEYDIEKKSGVPRFPNQPSWRSTRHIVTDVRVSDSNPSIFYVIAKRPDLDDATYQKFLSELRVISSSNDEQPTTSFVDPIDDFKNRITKKPFGIFITPETSPVQPDKFTGYHTAVDVEYVDVSNEVPVRAVAPGEVTVARYASGYGGVVVVRHNINGETIQSLYGHLDPDQLPSVGNAVTAGEQIGVLGAGETAETDGARKHLHFGILKGSTVDIRGYVSSESDLANWYDPLLYL